MPILKIPLSMRGEFVVSPDTNVRDVGCITRGSVHPFFGRHQVVKESVDFEKQNPFNDKALTFDDDFKPQSNIAYYMHIDVGTKENPTGIAMGHVVGFSTIERQVVENGEYRKTNQKLPIIDIDFLGSISAEDIGGEVLVSDIRDLIIYKLRELGFYLRLITFDSHGSLQIMQELRQAGFVVAHLSLDRTTTAPIVDFSKETKIRKKSTETQYMSAWESLRDAIYDKRITVPYHPEYLKQCKRAEEDEKKKKVKSNIKHYTLDMLESIAGTAFNIVNNESRAPQSNVEQSQEYQAAEAREDSFYRDLEADSWNRDTTHMHDSFYDDGLI